MACLDMYNNNSNNNNSDHHKSGAGGFYGGGGAPMSPRISFSNDFAETTSCQQMMRSSRSDGAPPPPLSSSDFEFSVTNYSMMSADELFFKGRLLPFKNNNGQKMTTLREELLHGDGDGDGENGNEVSQRPPKVGSSSSSSSSTRWRGLLGLKRTHHIGSKKSDKTTIDGSDGNVNGKRSGLLLEDSHLSKTSQASTLNQEMLNGGGTSCREVEMGI